MTQKVLSNLPMYISIKVEDLKKQYRMECSNRDIVRAEIKGYLHGLRHGGILKSDSEYRALFSYMTL